MAKFNDYESVGREYNIGGSDWFKFKSGDNKVRFVTELQEYASHFLKAEKKNVTCEGEFCEHCFKKDVKRRVQFIGWILDRADGAFKLVSVGWSVFKQIGEYAVSEEWGFTGIPPYDFIVKKSGEGLGTEYTVMPTKNEAPLSVEQTTKQAELNDPVEIVAKMKEKNPGSRLERPMKKTIGDDEIPIIGGKADEEDEVTDEKDLPF